MLKLAPIFKDHLVLQREKPLRVWGTADTSTLVTVTLAGQSACAETVEGRWEVTLPAMPAGGPYVLTATDGNDTCTVSDVMLGEVWLCGGQSNMERAIRDTAEPEKALATCKTSNVRLYHVGKRAYFDEQFYAEEEQSQWQLPDAVCCAWWTAVGYYFAEELARKLGVTVGLVECNYGGSSVTAWMPEDMLNRTAAGQAYLNDYTDGMKGLTDEEAMQAYQEYCRYHEAWRKRIDDCYREDPMILWEDALKKCGENRYPGPWAPNNPLRPHGLYDTMVARIIPYTLRGVLYYQGEADEHRPESYAELLTCLICQWRQDFRDETLPFLLVQLPMFAYEETKDGTNWAELRRAQEQVYRNVRNTGLAVILDCGEFCEIHPKEKRIPAHRLYLQALREVYHLQTADTTAPMLRCAVPENGSMRLSFDNAEGGLVLHGTAGFEVCSADGVWYPADVQVNGSELVLSSPKVCCPTGARYAWINYGDVTLFAQNGLPAAPFLMYHH
ncbi:MAG: sialate O-acetylesterase [Oscillospiraceae bacterium]|nr:sialate O-acetylesterase [Oscillospiraceae bacterium]